MNAVIIGIIFFVIFVVIIKVAVPMLSESKVSKKRVSDLVDVDESFAQVQDEFTREKSSTAHLLESFVIPFRNIKAEEAEINYKLQQAGVTSPDSASYYLFFSTFGPVIGLFILLLFYGFGKSQPNIFLLVMIVGLFWAAIATFGAKLWLKNSIEKRQKVLIRSFPDTLDLLLVCVESGLALDASLARVCKELKFAHPEMTKELNRLRVELTMLNDREKALINFTKRTDLIAVKSLVAALLQSEKFGTSLIDTLRVLSDDYRQTRMMLAEEKAGKLPSKIAVSTLPLMLLALLLLIAAPAIIQANDVISKSDVSK